MDLKRIVRIAMMAALIFAGTYTFKIPIAITGGYTHLGDCAIFVGVILLGRKDGALAAALGAALSDLLSGAMLWVMPPFLITATMALIMALAVDKLMPEHRSGLSLLHIPRPRDPTRPLKQSSSLITNITTQTS